MKAFVASFGSKHDLARNPSSGGKIEPKNINERDVGLAGI
jgi:hypothetical protein